MARVIGAASFSRRLKTLNKEAVLEVGSALFAGGEVIMGEARVSLTTGAVTGKNHVPSLPGEPPNNNWGTLRTNINTIQTAPLRVEVESAAPYAVALEFGTSKMAARPYMGPAARKSRKEVNEIITKAVNRAVRKK